MAERGSRLRHTKDGRRKTSIGGTPLRISELSGALTKVVGFQGTICAAEPFDYLIRKVNDQQLPELVAANAARATVLEAIPLLVRLLHWQDFELLVELLVYVCFCADNVRSTPESRRFSAWAKWSAVDPKGIFQDIGAAH